MVGSGGWGAVNGGWAVGDGGWRAADSGWVVGDGGWVAPVAEGRWTAVDGSRGVGADLGCTIDKDVPDWAEQGGAVN